MLHRGTSPLSPKGHVNVQLSNIRHTRNDLIGAQPPAKRIKRCASRTTHSFGFLYGIGACIRWCIHLFFSAAGVVPSQERTISLLFLPHSSLPKTSRQRFHSMMLRRALYSPDTSGPRSKSAPPRQLDPKQIMQQQYRATAEAARHSRHAFRQPILTSTNVQSALRTRAFLRVRLAV